MGLLVSIVETRHGRNSFVGRCEVLADSRWRLSPHHLLNHFLNCGSISTIYPSPDDQESALKLRNAGNFYGTTEETGNEAYGTVFQVTTNRTLTSLASFFAFGGNVYPSALTLGNDGNFYGTTEGGGSVGASYGDGTVFKVTTNG